MADGYAVFTLVWENRPIEVSHQANWLHSGHWHIELRSPERLPITATGYRSIFVPEAGFADEAQIEVFVVQLLDEVAQDKVWRAYLLDSRQLKLI